MGHRKRHKTYQETAVEDMDQFDQLPDDLVVLIMSKLASSASCPADFLSVLSACKRLNRLALHPVVLSKAGPKAVAIKAKNWSESAHQFLKQCATAGSPEAAYTLGMIRFYCLQIRATGASLMAKAAMKSHIQALYSLAVIQFNGSGGSKNDKDLQAGVALTARAAFLGHIDALRELGHCLQDGYGVPRNVAEGRRFLVQANARELASFLRAMGWQPPQPQPQPQSQQQKRSSLYQYLRATVDAVASGVGCPLLSDFGCNVPSRAVHPVNQFLKEWFEPRYGDLLEKGLTLCSHSGCGRPETRPHEFRRCSVCGNVNYCSRGCQALDWKLRHKAECVPHEEQWLAAAAVDENVMEGIAGMEGLNHE